jgi:hypothetical protein
MKVGRTTYYSASELRRMEEKGKKRPSVVQKPPQLGVLLVFKPLRFRPNWVDKPGLSAKHEKRLRAAFEDELTARAGVKPDIRILYMLDYDLVREVDPDRDNVVIAGFITDDERWDAMDVFIRYDTPGLDIARDLDV